MLTWEELQAEHATWLASRYAGQTPKSPLAGIVGEAGEAHHALLSEYKERMHGQNPRHTGHNEAFLDALGDMVIYIISWCNTTGTSITEGSWDTPCELPADPLDLGVALVEAACISYRVESPTWTLTQLVSEACRARGTTALEVANKAWEQVKGRIR